MNKPFKIKGYWFLPNQEEQKVAGILSYEPGENIRLELFGTLTKESPEKFLDKLVNNWNDIEVIHIIHGHTSDGNIFSLVDCLEGPSSLNSSAEFPLTSLTVNTAIRGFYLKEIDEKKFTKIRIGYNLFREWLGLNGFKRLEPDKQTSVAVSYKHPEIGECTLNCVRI